MARDDERWKTGDPFLRRAAQPGRGDASCLANLRLARGSASPLVGG